MQMKRTIKNIFETDAIFGIGLVDNSQRNLNTLYQEAEVALEYSFFVECGVFDYGSLDDAPNRFDSSVDLPIPNLKTLWKYIKDRDEPGLRGYVDAVFEPFLAYGAIESLRHIYNDFISFIKLIAKERGFESSPAMGDAKLSYAVFDSLCGLQSVHQYIMDLCVEMISWSADANAKGYSYLVRKCIGFMKQNYSSNITLGDIADNLNVSKCYLSMLFKQEVNIALSAYLAAYRIEQAKDLILGTNEKMYEIALRVGFDNPYYFSKVFKEVTGMTCKEFRNSNDALIRGD